MPSDDLMVIPSTFQQLDTRVTSDDQFLNRRDAVVMARNLNILQSRRQNQPCLHITAGEFNGFNSDYWVMEPIPMSPVGPRMLAVPVYIPRAVDECTFVYYGRAISATPDAKVYCCLHSSNDNGEYYRDQVITLTNTHAKHSITVRMPRKTKTDLYTFSMAAQSSTYTSDLLGSDAIVEDYGIGWVQLNTSISTTPVAIIFKDSGGTVYDDMLIRSTKSVFNIGGGSYRVTVTGGGWERDLISNSDKANTREINRVEWKSLCLYPEPPALFAERKR